MERLAFPLINDIPAAKARLDEIDLRIAALIRERASAASNLDRLLSYNAKAAETETRNFQRAIYAEDMYGPGITGFENSPMRGKK